MSKIAQYLNEHILGEATTDPVELKQHATDASILSITPEIVAYPRQTNDIRKITRFTYQLASKGHAMSVIARGGGTDRTGASIGKGIIVNTTKHMNHIFEFDSKQKLVRLQPGVTFSALNEALQLQGCHVPTQPDGAQYSTIGGAIANNCSGYLSGKNGAMDEFVEELEVVLSNGDVIQTGKLSKGQLSKKKALQTLEGEIYRTIDGLIEDNKALIQNLYEASDIDNSGYRTIAQVKKRNGTFNLTPLFVGSQGTLGIVSEIIMRTEYYSGEETMLAIMAESDQQLHDLMDIVRKFQPDYAEVYNAQLFEQAKTHGKKYALYENASAGDKNCAGIIVCGYTDFNDHARKKKLKKIQKALNKVNMRYVAADSVELIDEMSALRGSVMMASQPSSRDSSAPSLFTGVYIPHERFEDCMKALSQLAAEHKITLPYTGHVLDGVYAFWPQFALRSVGGKQKMLKLYGEFVKVIEAYSGSVVAESGEGRLKRPFTQQDDDLDNLYAKIRETFDPYKTLNGGIKEPVDLKSIVSHLK